MIEDTGYESLLNRVNDYLRIPKDGYVVIDSEEEALQAMQQTLREAEIKLQHAQQRVDRLRGELNRIRVKRSSETT
ncbi:MAG: hypothetical protein AAGA91_14570 [Pseudomonadota bacterium]